MKRFWKETYRVPLASLAFSSHPDYQGNKRLKNSLQSWNSNFATNRSCKFYINFSIWSESEKLSVELSADIPFPKKLSILFWSYFTLFLEQTWDTATFKNHFLM